MDVSDFVKAEYLNNVNPRPMVLTRDEYKSALGRFPEKVKLTWEMDVERMFTEYGRPASYVVDSLGDTSHVEFDPNAVWDVIDHGNVAFQDKQYAVAFILGHCDLPA